MQYRSADIPQEIGSRFWSSLIAPRPVFLLVTQSSDGISNIAAYSSVALISIYPPVICISFGKRQGQFKNTLANLLATSSFSINAVSRTLAETANESAEGVATVDDFARLSLAPQSFRSSSAIAVAESPASIACEYLNTVEIPGAASILVLARCVEVLASDDCVTDGLFDSIKANLVGSIGLEDFISVKGEAFTLPRKWE